MKKSKDIKMNDLVVTLLSKKDGLRLPELSPVMKPNSMCFNMVPVEGIPYHLAILTTYGATGKKDYRAMSLDKFLSVVTRFEDSAFAVTRVLKQSQKDVFSFENVVVGSGNTGVQYDFALSVGAHRYAFIRDTEIGLFLRHLASNENRQEWKEQGIPVIIAYNN